MFFYEKWDVFKLALRLRDIVRELSAMGIPGIASDMDNLKRAASSVLHNIGEGAKDTYPGKKIDRYSTAQASASECNVGFIVLAPSFPDDAQRLLEEGRAAADRISAMMTNLIKSVRKNWKDKPGPG